MGGAVPGPLGRNNDPVIDEDTLNLQRTSAPGTLFGSDSEDCFVTGPILVGKPEREPGKNPDGSVYEDMLFADSPAQSAEIRSDPVFSLSTAELQGLGRDLMNSVSFGDLNTVALECWDRFCAGTGGTYTNEKLTKAVQDNAATTKFTDEFAAKLRTAIMGRLCDITSFTPLTLGHYSFDTLTDKAGGLGIIVHDWWSIKAELKDYAGTWNNRRQQGAFIGTIVYTMTDDFALDWNDIVLHGDDAMPPTVGWYTTGDRFKAWYILQHYRTAKPFFVEVKLEYDIIGGDLTLLSCR